MKAEETRNELERLIERMQAGDVAPEEFAARLLEQQVFIPVKDDKRRIGGFQSSTLAETLVAQDEEGQRALILFSDPARAADFLKAYPGYSGGMIEQFSWILRRMGAGIGIAINPGQEPGFDFDPDMVAMLVTLLPEEAS